MDLEIIHGVIRPATLAANPVLASACYDGGVVLCAPEYDAVLRRAMVLMTCVDGHVRDEELIRIRWLVSKLFAEKITTAQARVLVAKETAADVHPAEYLRPLEPQLSSAQKQTLLKVAFAIASADGEVANAEDVLLVEIAQALRIGPAAYRTILTHAMVAREFL